MKKVSTGQYWQNINNKNNIIEICEIIEQNGYKVNVLVKHICKSGQGFYYKIHEDVDNFVVFKDNFKNWKCIDINVR